MYIYTHTYLPLKVSYAEALGMNADVKLSAILCFLDQPASSASASTAAFLTDDRVLVWGLRCTYSLHCTSFLGLPFGILNIELVKPQKGTTMETRGKVSLWNQKELLR